MGLATTEGHVAQCMGLGTVQTISVAASSAAGSAVASTTRIVRLYSTTNCHVRFGSAPTAVTTDTFLPAGVPEYFGINPGEIIAVIRNSADGTLYITEDT